MAAGSERPPPENEKRRPGQEAADLENGTLNVFQYQTPEAGKQLVPAIFDEGLGRDGERVLLNTLRHRLATPNKTSVERPTSNPEIDPDDDALREAAADTNAALKLLGGPT
jgi:hypothetical protein